MDVADEALAPVLTLSRQGPVHAPANMAALLATLPHHPFTLHDVHLKCAPSVVVRSQRLCPKRVHERMFRACVV